MSSPVRIVFGVTIAESLKFLGSVPSLLANAGWDVHLVSDPGKDAQIATTGNVAFHGIPMARKPSIARDIRALVAWFGLLGKIKPAIVSIGTPKAALLGIFAAWVLRVPRRVYILRGLRLETMNGLSRWLLYFLEYLTAGCATHVLAVSHSLATKYEELGLCAAAKITVLESGSSHGVDIERFSPKPFRQVEAARMHLALAPKVPVLGFVGRFSKDKGASAIVATRETLLREGIDHEILFVGSVEDSQNLLDELNSRGRSVKQVGEVARVEDFYPVMTALILPTKREGFPNVVLEAGAMGIPTVTRCVTGAVDAVKHGVTGILVSGGSDQQFATAVLNLLTRAKESKRLGTNARVWISQNYDSRKVAESLTIFYERIR